MKPLDDQLRKLLRRREPPDDFAASVLSRLPSESRARKSLPRIARWWWRPALRWIAATAACLLLALGLVRYEHQRRMRVQTEQASRQAIWALEIAGNELRTTFDQAQQITAQALAATQKLKNTNGVTDENPDSY